MDVVYPPIATVIQGVVGAKRWKVRVSGAEHVPAEGGAIIASNHISYLDFVFVGLGARQRGRLVRFAAKKEIFDHPLVGPVMRAMKHLPVDREARAGDIMELVADAAARGEVIGMFPEATISRAFVPKRAKPGAARMALDAGVPLIPAAVWGTQRLKTKGMPEEAKPFPSGVAVSVGFAPPVDLSDGDSRAATDRLMGSITALVGDLQRTYPQEPTSDADRWWLPAHLGGTAPTVAEAEALAEQESTERRDRRAAQRRARRDEAAPPDEEG